MPSERGICIFYQLRRCISKKIHKVFSAWKYRARPDRSGGNMELHAGLQLSITVDRQTKINFVCASRFAVNATLQLNQEVVKILEISGQ